MTSTRTSKQDLKPGVKVRIKSWEEIKPTITIPDRQGNAIHKNHPLGWFGPMKRSCGKTFTLLRPYNEDLDIWELQDNTFIWHRDWFALV